MARVRWVEKEKLPWNWKFITKNQSRKFSCIFTWLCNLSASFLSSLPGRKYWVDLVTKEIEWTFALLTWAPEYVKPYRAEGLEFLGKQSWEEQVRRHWSSSSAGGTVLITRAFLGSSRKRVLASQLQQASQGPGCVQLPAKCLVFNKWANTNVINVLTALLPIVDQVFEREEWFWCLSLVEDVFLIQLTLEKHGFELHRST